MNLPAFCAICLPVLLSGTLKHGKVVSDGMAACETISSLRPKTVGRTLHWLRVGSLVCLHARLIEADAAVGHAGEQGHVLLPRDEIVERELIEGGCGRRRAPAGTSLRKGHAEQER